jgi:hypothetical protein
MRITPILKDTASKLRTELSLSVRLWLIRLVNRIHARVVAKLADNTGVWLWGPEEYTGVLDEGHQVVGGFTDPEKHKERLRMAKDQLPGLTAAAGPRDGDPRDHPLPPAVFPDSPLSA